MAIEIYDKAKIIKKDNTYYYFLKNGSKNCFTCPFQTIVDNNFNNKFIRRQTRESNWHVIAISNYDDFKSNKIADTNWNAPTSWYYGQIRFGNKKNIALFFSKTKPINYDILSINQQYNIDNYINYYINELMLKYTIDLGKIDDKNKMKPIQTYCNDEPILLDNNYIIFNGKKYWDLDNL